MNQTDFTQSIIEAIAKAPDAEAAASAAYDLTYDAYKAIKFAVAVDAVATAQAADYALRLSGN